MSDSSEALWRELDAHIDARIAAYVNKPTGITPNQPISGIVFDRFGRAVSGATAGASVFLCKYTGIAATTITSSSTKRLDFATAIEDLQGLVTTGASWAFVPVTTAWYAPTVYLSLFPDGGDLSAGDYFRLHQYNGASNIVEIYRYVAPGTIPASTRLPVFVRVPLQFNNGQNINIRLENVTTQTLLISDGYIAFEKLS